MEIENFHLSWVEAVALVLAYHKQKDIKTMPFEPKRVLFRWKNKTNMTVILSSSY